MRALVNVLLLLSLPTATASALTLELSAAAILRPQAKAKAIPSGGATMLDDDRLNATVVAIFSDSLEAMRLDSLVLERRELAKTEWREVHRFASGPLTLDPHPPPLEFPREFDPDRLPPKGPVTRRHEATALVLPAKTRVIRARARLRDGREIRSSEILVTVEPAPRILTLISMGGSCFNTDGRTSHRTLPEGEITRDRDVCEDVGVNATFIGDLTPMASVNCNDLCNRNCVNFIEHLAERVLEERGLANELQAIDNPGKALCHPRSNAEGVRNRIVIGKWRSTDEEPACPSQIRFNAIIDDFVGDGGRSLILVGQSLGGAKFADMVRDHWRWGTALKLELFATWDATSFTGQLFKPLPECRDSMGVSRVGGRPLHMLNFWQCDNAIPFQNGSVIVDVDEQYNLNKCLSHNAIARSQFVHARTTDAIAAAVTAARDRVRSGQREPAPTPTRIPAGGGRCIRDIDCAANERCESGLCKQRVSRCTSNAQCPPGSACFEGACHAF